MGRYLCIYQRFIVCIRVLLYSIKAQITCVILMNGLSGLGKWFSFVSVSDECYLWER